MTNEELLSHSKIGPELAARYLQNGTTAQEIRVMAQNGLCPFCDAIKGKGRYSYRVNIGLLMRFKAGELGLYAHQKKQGGNQYAGTYGEQDQKDAAGA